jgi:hypothetical protein
MLLPSRFGRLDESASAACLLNPQTRASSSSSHKGTCDPGNYRFGMSVLACTVWARCRDGGLSKGADLKERGKASTHIHTFRNLTASSTTRPAAAALIPRDDQAFVLSSDHRRVVIRCQRVHNSAWRVGLHPEVKNAFEAGESLSRVGRRLCELS